MVQPVRFDFDRLSRANTLPSLERNKSWRQSVAHQKPYPLHHPNASIRVNDWARRSTFVERTSGKTFVNNGSVLSGLNASRR